MQKKKIRSLLTVTLAVMMLGQNLSLPAAYGASMESTIESASQASVTTGKWMTGEYHAHTYESNDAQESLTDVLDTAFEKNGLDWLALADHLRMSNRDDQGVALPGGPIPMSQGIAAFQTPIIKQLQASGKYAGKIIFSGFEWDMPQYDHAAVGIVTDQPGSDAALKAINQFEYLFTNRDVSLFNPADVAAWNAADTRAFTSKEDTRKGIQWISDHYPDSYVLINHPSRKNGGSSELKIADMRDFNNIDPDVAFGLEGMLGNQMAADRGETVEVFGGTDVKVAKVGGFWDALLGEGRRIWNFANSDFHFKTKNDQFSSGYWPGEYSKNYTWVEGSDIHAVVDGMRSGKSFSVFGDLIDALDFHVSGDGRQEGMGGELDVKEGDNLELTIRFKSPEKNNNGDPVQVDHVDLISGEVTGKVQPGTPEYNKASNDSTKVVARFTSKDWTTDAEGYNVITYKLGAADKDRYFRLRGTNLGVDVPGETSNGEPLLDEKNLTVDNLTRFAEINARNYHDMWFYSNPVFVSVEPFSDQQAVDETVAALALGDTSGVTANLNLPTEGKHGTSIVWESSNPVLMANDGTIVFRPKKDTLLTLTATIRRGTASETKAFEVNLSGDDSITPLELQGTMTTADGKSYPSGAWTNQGVTVSVYASVYVPGSTVSIQVSMDGAGSSQPYESKQPIDISAEGQHQLQFQATDSLGNTAAWPLAVNIDRTAPVITLKGAGSVSLTQGDSFADPGAEITDKLGIPGTLIVTGKVDTETPGTYKLHYNVKDLAGNAAEEAVRTVVVTARTGSGNGNGSGGSGGGSGNSGTVTAPGSTSPTGNAGEPSVNELKLEVNAQQGATGILKGVASFTIPAGALPADSKIALTALAAGQTPSTGKLQAVSAGVKLTGTHTGNLNKPVELSLAYDAAKITSGHKAAVYYYNEQRSKWIYVGGDENPKGTITVDVNRFATFAVFNYEVLPLNDLNNHWVTAYADRLIGMEIMKGFGDQSFRPDEAVTRTQFASIIVRTLGLQSSGNTVKFADQNAIPAWAAGDIAAAVESGIIHGYEEGGKSFFKGSEIITRAEMSVMLANALNTSPHKKVDNRMVFADHSATPRWAQASIDAGVAAGILGGFEDHTFRPERTATRAEAAATVYKLLGALSS